MSTAASTATARRLLACAVAAVLLGWLAGCGPPVGAPDGPPSPLVAATEPGSVPTARVGRPGKTERVHFVPETLVLPGGARAEVKPATTSADGQLQVPENVQHVGWWDGSADAGDPFGRTVIAGHVDSATGGDGFFARLDRIKQGDVVTLGAGSHRLSYKITARQEVARYALATKTQAFDQKGPHRLVLITCTGDYRRDRGGYQENLVVIGTPLGLVR